MTNSTKRIISLVLFCVLFIASFSGSIYANVQASKQKALYTEQASIAEKYEKQFEKSQNSDNPIFGSQYFRNLFQEKATESRVKAETIKKEMRMYFIFMAVLMFVSLAMLACSIITALPLIKNKKQNGDDEDDENEEIETVEKNTRQSDFDIILEAPKPHINSEE